MAVQHKRSLLALVSLGAGLVLFALNFAFPLQAVIPLGLAALGMMYHPSVSVCAALLAMALSAIVRGPEAAVLLFMFASGGLIMPFLVRKKVSSLYTVFIAASVTIITLWCGMVFFADVINAAFARGKTAIIEQFAFLERSGLGAAFFSADQLNAMRSMNVLMLEILGDALAGMMFGYSMILALLMYLLCRKIAQKRGTPLAPFAKFAQWRLPAGFGFRRVYPVLRVVFGRNQLRPGAGLARADTAHRNHRSVYGAGDVRAGILSFQKEGSRRGSRGRQRRADAVPFARADVLRHV